jgi:hypothetical protein
MEKSFVVEAHKNRLSLQVADQVLHEHQSIFIKGQGFDLPADEALDESFAGPQSDLFPSCRFGAEKQTKIPQIEQPVL